MFDTGAQANCILEGLIPTKYYEKTIQKLRSANDSKMNVNYKLPKAHICQDNVCFKTSFILVKDMNDEVILRLPFIYLLTPFKINNEGLTTKPFDQTVHFKFVLKSEIKELRQLKDNSVSEYIRIIN